MQKLLLTLCSFVLAGCHSIPAGVEPVADFNINRYLGKWYEIARLDHSFERGLEGVTAEYTLLEDGRVKVLNRGYSVEKQQWKEAVGKAYLAEDDTTGFLKVSFFGPFYSSYVIFGLDREEYRYAYVSGPDTSYLWLLSRSPTVDNHVIQNFTSTARKLGFNTDELLYVKQNVPAPL